MAVRSKALVVFFGVLPANALTAVWVCPPGRTAIMKELTVQPIFGATRDVVASVRRGSDLVPILRALQVPVGTLVTTLQRDIVLEPGDELVVSGGSTPDQWRVGAFGSLLAGVAS